MSVPEGIVSQYKTAWSEDGEHHLVALAVGTFVTVDKGHIKFYAKFRGFRQRITDNEVDLVCYSRTFYPWTGEILHLVVDLKGVESSAFLQAFCHRDGTVTAERSYFEDGLWTDHLHQHLQESPLQVPTGHPSVDGADVRGPPQPVEILWFRLRMRQYILLQ